MTDLSEIDLASPLQFVVTAAAGSSDAESKREVIEAALRAGGRRGDLLEILKKLDAERELGLEPRLLPHIVRTLCEELLACGYEAGSLMGNVDDSALAPLMPEISDPALQRKVLRLSPGAVRADGHLADGEALVVDAARRHWNVVDGEVPGAAKVAHRLAA